jgi:hypothetical protein
MAGEERRPDQIDQASPTDVPLRLRLTDSGHELYVRRYGWDVIVPTVVDLARGVA